jgi:hypothetical protein
VVAVEALVPVPVVQPRERVREPQPGLTVSWRGEARGPERRPPAVPALVLARVVAQLLARAPASQHPQPALPPVCDPRHRRLTAAR